MDDTRDIFVGGETYGGVAVNDMMVTGCTGTKSGRVVDGYGDGGGGVRVRRLHNEREVEERRGGKERRESGKELGH